MSAAFQPVPTIRQRRAFAKPHGIRQYEHTQALISPVEAAGIACCDVTPDVPRPGEDGEPRVWEWVDTDWFLALSLVVSLAWFLVTFFGG